jgi:hypothetical protein
MMGTGCLCDEQEKILAQIESEPKAAPAKAAKAAAKDGEEEEAEEDEEDPVETALAKYGIITENPWEKDAK